MQVLDIKTCSNTSNTSSMGCSQSSTKRKTHSQIDCGKKTTESVEDGSRDFYQKGTNEIQNKEPIEVSQGP